MGKGKIFIGEIMADQIAALELLQTSMGSLETAMDSQVLKMDDQITALGEINSSVASTINTLFVKPDPTLNEIILNAADVSPTTADVVVKTVLCLANGSITVSGKLKSNSTSYYSIFQCSIDGGTAIELKKTNSTTYQSFSYDLQVRAGTVMSFIMVDHGGVPTLEAGAKITFDYATAIEAGAIVV